MRSGLRQGPDPAVMRGNVQPDLLQGRYVFQVQRPSVKLLDVIARDREPERDALIRIPEIGGYKSVLAAVEPGKKQDAKFLITIPVVEEEVRATTHVVPLTANAEEPAHQADDGLTGFVIKEVPTERPE